MITEKIIEELENIRIRLTQIYLEIDKQNIKALRNNEADMVLRKEIELIKNNNSGKK